MNYLSLLTSYEELQNLRQLEIESESISINPDLLLVRDEVRDTISIVDLVVKSPKVLIRYSNINWGMCNGIDRININRIANELGRDNVIFLTPYSNEKDLIFFKNNNDLNLPIYQFVDSHLSLPIERVNEPFILFLDKNLNTSMVISLKHSEINGFDWYLRKVRELLPV